MAQLMVLAQALPAVFDVVVSFLLLLGIAVFVGKNAWSLNAAAQVARRFARWIARRVDAEFRQTQTMAKAIAARSPRLTAFLLASGSGFLYAMAAVVSLVGACMVVVVFSASGSTPWYLPLAVAGFIFALAVNIIHLITSAHGAHQLARDWYGR